MSHVMRFFGVLKGVPSAAWVTLTLFGFAIGAWQWHTGAVSSAYKKGGADMLARAKVDSALIAMTIQARAKAMARTDTVFVSVKEQAASVDRQARDAADLARQLPPEISALPEVVALKQAVFHLEITTKTLKDSITSLDKTLTTERAAHTTAVSVIEAQLTEARLVTIKKDDELRAEVARPKRTIKGTVITAVIGAGLAEAARLGITILLRR